MICLLQCNTIQNQFVTCRLVQAKNSEPEAREMLITTTLNTSAVRFCLPLKRVNSREGCLRFIICTCITKGINLLPPDAFLRVKMHANALSTGALLQNPLGELTTLPRLFCWVKVRGEERDGRKNGGRGKRRGGNDFVPVVEIH